jgi:hypothetical protein
MQRLRAEACRMGGDIIYNVPRRPYRPREQVMVFRGQVAHTRGRSAEEEKLRSQQDEAAPPPASAEESAGPIVPLTGVAAPPAPAPSPSAAPAPSPSAAPAPSPPPDGGSDG